LVLFEIILQEKCESSLIMSLLKLREIQDKKEINEGVFEAIDCHKCDAFYGSFLFADF